MRPIELSPLFAETISLKGVGAHLAKTIQKIAGSKIIHLLLHFPTGLIDRRYQPKIKEAIPGKIGTLKVIIDAHKPSKMRGKPYRVLAHDETGDLEIVFFNGRKSYLEGKLPIGKEIMVSGKIEFYNDKCQITHPDYVFAEGEETDFDIIEPIYPLTAGLSGKALRRSIKYGLERIPLLPEWHSDALLKEHHWPDVKTAFESLHNPETQQDLSLDHPARRRVAYDEFLSNQLALAFVRQRYRQSQGQQTVSDERLIKKTLENLPFKLTNAQEAAIDEILNDMRAPTRMLRLLQGDVGSGKTILAFLAMAGAVGSGFQAAIMAPTEILARQHYEGLQELCDIIGIQSCILTGREKGKKRKETLEKIVSGEAQVIFGTHALFQEDVIYKNLGFAVIDEQHRFGVHQRLQLSEKGTKTDILVMTATPIPRTLTLTAYGDMDCTRLLEKPPGRKPIDTRSMQLAKLNDLLLSLKRVIESGGQAYWICPLVDESEVMDLAAATERVKTIEYLYPKQVGLVHGKMKAAEKDEVMARFANNEIKILVATTVIEVGINVPNASVMIIEHAERFGLSQLHQLRGRVGRGDRASHCILLYAHPINDIARARIDIMRKTEDGFLIAEEDLKLRGTGDILGTRQSGFPEFKAADLEAHKDLLEISRKDAEHILHTDPDLKTTRGKALRSLLYFWERDHAISYLKSG